MMIIRSGRPSRRWNTTVIQKFRSLTGAESMWGTITEGDLLWYVKEDWDLNIREAENVRIMNIKRKRKTAAVSVNANMEDLIEKAMNQNFVPVVDDKEIFIGIVKRKDIIHYCYEHMERKDDR